MHREEPPNLLWLVLSQLVMHEMSDVLLYGSKLFLLHSEPFRRPGSIVCIVHKHGLTNVQILGDLETLHHLQSNQPFNNNLMAWLL